MREFQVFPQLKPNKIRAISLAAIIIFLLLWFAVTWFSLVPEVILPSPLGVLASIKKLLFKGFAGASLFEHIGISLLRVFVAIFFATLLAVPLGIIVALNDYINGVINPFIEFYRPLPPLAYLPLVIIWFGVGEMSKYILIYLAVFAPIFLNTRAGVSNIPKERIRAALSLGASRMQLIIHIVFPSALHSILTGIRIGAGFGWTTLVAAEMVAATSGLGYMILSASEFLQTEVVIMGIILIGAFALLTDFFLNRIIVKYIHWQGP